MLKRALTVLLCTAALLASQSASTTQHKDHRRGLVKLQFLKSDGKHYDKQSGEQRAKAFLAKNHAQYGLPEGLTNLELWQVKESLLGTHYHYQQKLHGYDVHRAEIIVSISKETGAVYQVFNNTYPVQAESMKAAPEALLNYEDAYDIAWHDLRVHDELMAYPAAKLVYQAEGPDFHLVYLVEFAVEGPFGYWEHTIDAKTGEVRDVRSTAISREIQEMPDFSAYDGPVLNRRAALVRFEDRQKDREINVAKASANGSGKVFDPDPATTLQRTDLQDTTAASTFNSAYVTRTLSDITLNNGTYSLTGPWITLANFESPNTAPSTNTTGNWTASRGNNAFNDAMTYFHVDQNQRYMQSLGFSGSTGIQYTSINVDTDGVNGDDNSHFIPSTNRMAFGHGCVDDNEDAFVILHEYGHAIHHSINNNWSGGDTGGMGEGFGDYWAGSYKFSTPNGASFHPEWAFPWDGHNNCWGGRNMNKTNFQYDPTKSYPAHATVGGVYSDELWSTPLFQSLLELTSQGVPRSQVDQIVLQAHFGLGSGLSMRDMATAIVSTAGSLYPSGPHQSVFQAKFEAQNILTGGTTPPPTGATELSNGQTLSSLSGAQGSEVHYFINIPSGATNLNIATSGGSGDCDLYVRFGAQPTTSTWDFRPYKGGNNETVTVPAPSTGKYYIMLRGYSAYSGMSMSVSYTGASSNQAPNASFTESINNLSVSFTDTSSDDNGITGRSWNFGDGGSSSAQNPSHTYASAGTYTVTLTVSDAGGLSDSASKSITVSAPVNTAPNASFSHSENNLTATFTDSSSDAEGPIASWSWNFGDGNTSSSQNPSHTYAAAGTYSVSLTVTDSGGLTNTATQSVTVSEPPTGGNQLTNGVPVTNLSAGTGNELHYTMVVPAGASNLTFATSGGSGDADLYVKFGSAPTTASYDYRPYLNGNNETVNVSVAQAGTYYVMVRAYSSFSGVSLTGSFTTGGGSGGTTTDTFTGTLSGKASANHYITVTGGTIDLSATWLNNRDIDLYLYNPSGTQVKSALSTSQPETLTYNTNGVTGQYRIRVYNYSSSSTTYTLEATYQP